MPFGFRPAVYWGGFDLSPRAEDGRQAFSILNRQPAALRRHLVFLQIDHSFAARRDRFGARGRVPVEALRSQVRFLNFLSIRNSPTPSYELKIRILILSSETGPERIPASGRARGICARSLDFANKEEYRLMAGISCPGCQRLVQKSDAP